MINLVSWNEGGWIEGGNEGRREEGREGRERKSEKKGRIKTIILCEIQTV